MNAERLLEEFDRLIEAPDAVPRLRELIWACAMNGSLSGSHSQRGWKHTTLGSLGRWGSGGTPRKGHPDYYDGDIPWLVIGDLNDGLVTAAATTITELGLANSSAKIVEPGTVLVAMYGSIGKLGLAGMRCTTNQAIAHCVPGRDVSAPFLMVALRSMRQALRARGQGGTQPNISQTILKAWPISLPPVSEQERIVAKVDDLMTVCDELETAQEQRERRRKQLSAASLARLTAAEDTLGRVAEKNVIFFLSHSSRMLMRAAHVADLRRAILDLAVTGRLVPQSPEHGPAEHPSFHRIDVKLEEMRSGGSLPLNWQIGPLGRWFTVSGGIQKQPKRIPQGNARPYVGVANVQRGRLNLEAVKEFELFPGELAKYRLEKGDLLVVEGNGSADEIGRCALWGGEIDDCVHQNHIIRCRPRVGGLEHFTLLYLNSPPGMGQMRRLAVTTAGLFNLSVGKIQRILIPIPSLQEQGRIVAKVDELMAICDELQRSLQAFEAGRARALEAVLRSVLEEGNAPLSALSGSRGEG